MSHAHGTGSVPAPAPAASGRATTGRAGASRAAAGPAEGRLSVAPDGTGWWARARWFVRGVMGENAYQAYLLHHERTGCQGPAMTEKEYWRSRTDWQEANPEGRCC